MHSIRESELRETTPLRRAISRGPGTSTVTVYCTTMEWLPSWPLAYRYGAALAFAAIVVVLSITPGVAKPGDSVFVWLVVNTATPVQKVMHVAVYALLCALWIWAFEPVRPTLLRVALAVAATISLGAALEWHQTQVPGRFGTVTDVLLNAAGAIAAALLALVLL